MSQFIPQATNYEGLDDIVEGFLQAAEFTMDEELACLSVRGWTRAAKAKATRLVRDFLAHAQPDDIEAYRDNYAPSHGYSIEQCLGHDVLYSTQGHGTGFFARGNHPGFDRLQDVARHVGRECNVWRTRGGWLQIDTF